MDQAILLSVFSNDTLCNFLIGEEHSELYSKVIKLPKYANFTYTALNSNPWITVGNDTVQTDFINTILNVAYNSYSQENITSVSEDMKILSELEIVGCKNVSNINMLHSRTLIYFSI